MGAASTCHRGTYTVERRFVAHRFRCGRRFLVVRGSSKPNQTFESAVLTISFLILFCVMAVRIAAAVSRESPIFREFNQSTALQVLVFLFPFGPLVLMVDPQRFGWLPPYILASGCYIPALLVANRVTRALERAGTDRVKQALTAASQAFGTALIGLIYVAGVFAIWMGSIFIA